MKDYGAARSNTAMTICKVPENEALRFDQAKLVAQLKSQALALLSKSAQPFAPPLQPCAIFRN